MARAVMYRYLLDHFHLFKVNFGEGIVHKEGGVGPFAIIGHNSVQWTGGSTLIEAGYRMSQVDILDHLHFGDVDDWNISRELASHECILTIHGKVNAMRILTCRNELYTLEAVYFNDMYARTIVVCSQAILAVMGHESIVRG